MQERVKIAVQDGIAEVRLNRPEKMNALDAAMFAGITAAGERLRDMAGLRAVVLCGEGRAFCAGIDLTSFENAAGQENPTIANLSVRSHGIANEPQHICTLWRTLPVPVIAAIHGVAFGGGLQLALGADIRIVTPDARLSIMEVKWGLVPDMAGFVLMRRILRDDVARELTFTGREFTGTDALNLGVATRLATDPLAEALSLARDITSRSPHAVRAAKRLFQLAADADDKTILLNETLEQQRLLGSPNQMEALAAGVARRPPRFSDL